MKKIIASILLSGLFCSCVHQNSNAINEARMDKLALDSRSDSDKRPKGSIPSDIGLNEIALDQAHHTWKDLDIFYKQVVLKTAPDADYLNNLKNICFFHLIEGYKMPEKADLATVEFYINEQANAKYLSNPKGLALCLDRMKGHWDDARIAQLVENVRQSQITTIQKMFSKNPDFIKRKSEEYNQYLVFAKD